MRAGLSSVNVADGLAIHAEGLVLRTPGSVMGVSMIVLLPLAFASNILVNPRTIPWWLVSIFGVLLIFRALVAMFALFTMYLYRNKK